MTTTTIHAADKLPPLRDPTAFVKAMAKAATTLAADLVTRAKDARIEPSLRESYDDEKAAGRTGEDFLTWRNAFCDQVAASWVLCTVFVRTLEDRGFLRHRVAGPSAADRLAQFQRMFRFLSERDYLRQVFDALAEPPPSWPRDRPADEWVGAQVFGRSSAPLWRLSPSAGALSAMLDALRAVDAEGVLLFTFGRPEGVEHDGSTTRFLGDLYQDLNEGVRKRYALLQTPDFVERFILDQTLTPALQERGIAVTVCDPTCGSGHFLLGAYDRLFEARTRQEPGRSSTDRARQALSQVYGIDLNPYAAAIARFRLVLSMMDKAGLTALEHVPDDLMVHIYVDDALLAGKVGGGQLGSGLVAHQQFEFGDAAGGKAAGFQSGLGFSFIDPHTDALLRRTRFDVVVANPPYITEKDATKRDKIRDAYPKSAAGKFPLSSPFVERVFDLANPGGWAGQITANSFMKREFGSKLIEQYLPTVDVTDVVDSSTAQIPGHGTPTVLIFGRRRAPFSECVRLIRSKGNRPQDQPDAAKAPVWLSINAAFAQMPYEDDFVSAEQIERVKLAQHPWSLGGGGAAELKELLEARGDRRLGEIVQSIGIGAVTGEDDVFLRPSRCFRRVNPEHKRRMIEGDQVRDWTVSPSEMTLFPYDADFRRLPLESVPGATELLWPYRNIINRRKRFGVPMLERGLSWYELQELYSDKLRTPLSISYAEIASHNHLVLDRGNSVFKQTAPIIKLPNGATEEEHLGILGYLSTSLVCAYLRQIAVQKMGSETQIHPDPARFFFAYNAGVVTSIPIPSTLDCFVEPTRALTAAAAERASVLLTLRSPERLLGSNATLSVAIRDLFIRADSLRQKMVGLQEELDWRAYSAFGMCSRSAVCLSDADLHDAVISRGERAFEARLGRHTAFWRKGRLLSPSEADAEWCPHRAPAGALKMLTEERVIEIQQNATINFVEVPSFKRIWRDSNDNVTDDEYRNLLVSSSLQYWMLNLVESEFSDGQGRVAPLGVGELARRLELKPGVVAVASILAGTANLEFEVLLGDLMKSDSVPSATAQVFTDVGIEKRYIWEKTWALQRLEDAGESVAISAPPKYDREDFIDVAALWRHRGKLDVPKERFIAYPTATPPAGASGAASLVFGWAGWTHLEQLQAAIALWQDEWAEHGNKLVPRTTRDALEGVDPAAVTDRAIREKLLPILQTMVDLLPWVRQWHNDDGETADQFDSYVEEQCRLLDMSRDDVHLWRIPARVRVTKKKASKKKATARAAAADE